MEQTTEQERAETCEATTRGERINRYEPIRREKRASGVEATGLKKRVSDSEMTKTAERWLSVPVEGFGELYSISDYGRVRNERTGYVLKPWPSGFRNEYLAVSLWNGRKNRAVKKVHRMVAEVFVSNDHGKPEVNHSDLDTYNNRADNLEWCTRSENELHKRFFADAADTKEYVDCVTTSCPYHTKDEPLGWCSIRERKKVKCLVNKSDVS